MDQEKTIQLVSEHNILIFSGLWGFLFGVFVSSIVFISPLVALLLIAVALASYYLERHAWLLIFIITCSLGILRYDLKDFHQVGTPSNIGVVVSEPDERDSDTRFVVETHTGEKVLVHTSLLSEVKYGDEINFSGVPKRVEAGGYADSLSVRDIFYTVNAREVEIVSSGHGNPVLSTLLKIKGVVVEKIRSILSEPEASLLAGLVVSGKQALPSQVLEEFRRSGVVHIVVLSGYNITIIAEFLFAAFLIFGNRYAALISLAGVTLFTLMAGAPATVMRGAIMVSLLMLGKIFGREGSAPRILLLTAVAMVFLNPKILLFDSSFHLSFLAMLGLIYGVPLIEKYFYFVPEKWGLRALVSATSATQLFVFPYLLYNMGNFSTVFLFTNLLILLVIPFTMLSGFLATLIAFISEILAWPLAFISHLLLAWILKVAHLLGSLPFALLEIENFPLSITLALYLSLGFIVWRSRSSLPPSASLSS